MALLGNPQDVLTTPYGYAGQMAPETAIAEQALNRRRLLANMLTQQGLQPAQGRMAGRFYVAPSPLQGGAGLAQVLAGTLGNRMIDNQQGDLMKQDRQMVEDAIKNWKERQSQAPVGAAPSQAPPTAPESAPPAPPTLPAGAGPETMQNIGPRPQSLPDQHTGVSDFRARPDTLQFGQNPQGLSQDVTPGDMSTMVNSADPAKAQAQLGEQPPMQPPAQVAPPAPPQAPAPMPQAGPRKTTMEDLAQLMTHQHPQVRAYGQFLAQQMQREQERGDQREFMANENALNRDVRREGILENSRMREAQIQNTMALTQMQIDAKMQAGHDANDLKASLAKQAAELQKLQIQTSAELKKAEMGSRADIAKQHDETLKTIAGMKAGSKEETKTAEQEKSKKDVEGIIAVLRDSYNQLKTGGGVTDVSKGGLENMGAAASSSGIGQALGKTFGTQNQSYRNTIAQQRPILMGNVSKALGMSAKQLDSNTELKLWLNAATDPTLDYQTNMRALDQLESMLANGPGGSSSTTQPAPATQRAVKRTGTHNGKKVVEYSDGTIEYAP